MTTETMCPTSYTTTGSLQALQTALGSGALDKYLRIDHHDFREDLLINALASEIVPITKAILGGNFFQGKDMRQVGEFLPRAGFRRWENSATKTYAWLFTNLVVNTSVLSLPTGAVPTSVSTERISPVLDPIQRRLAILCEVNKAMPSPPPELCIVGVGERMAVFLGRPVTHTIREHESQGWMYD